MSVKITLWYKIFSQGIFTIPKSSSTFCVLHGVRKSQEKVSFNIASEASYVHILSKRKFIKNTKNCPFLASFWKPEVCGQTVLPDRSVLIGKNWRKMPKFKNSNATFWGIFNQCDLARDDRQVLILDFQGGSRPRRRCFENSCGSICLAASTSKWWWCLLLL